MTELKYSTSKPWNYFMGIPYNLSYKYSDIGAKDVILLCMNTNFFAIIRIKFSNT